MYSNMIVIRKFLVYDRSKPFEESRPVTVDRSGQDACARVRDMRFCRMLAGRIWAHVTDIIVPFRC